MSGERGAVLYEIVRQVRPLTLDSARIVSSRVASLGLGVGTRAVLEVLAEIGPATVPTIAARLNLTRQAVQRHVDDLLQRDDVRRRSNPAHRRSVLLELTETGRSVFERVRADELDQLDGLALGCTDAELAAAVKVLRELARDVRERAAGQGFDEEVHSRA